MIFLQVILMIVFISGGVRSGKSGVAEQYVRQFASSENPVHYIATAQITDEEMQKRIMHHQQERARQSLRWITWEQPYELHAIVDRFTEQDVILLDCLTNLLANELFWDEGWRKEEICFQKARRIFEAIQQLGNNSKALIIVSNELFHGGVPEDPGTFRFMKMLGWLHQEIVAISSLAILVQNGIPILKKGGEEVGS
jgi:adenosylcobinamide kinase/adenosylcobinamide-phosphate guanylyltransferase